MAMMKESVEPRTYDGPEDNRTKQGFADSTDINKLLARAQKGEAITHLAKYGAMYGDFSDIGDLMEAHEKLQRGTAIFRDLPGEVRREFDNDPGKFFRYVNDPEHVDKLDQLIPGLTKRGNDLPALNTGVEPQPPTAPPPAEPPPPGDAPTPE